jgi:hypothetical protein
VPEVTVRRLSEAWREFGERECGTYSPLYAAICRSVAADPDLLARAAAAPPAGQQPNVLLAAVHYLLLDGLAHPLAEVYAGRADPGAAPALFRDLCRSEWPRLARLLASRHTQTNEPGRAGPIAVGLAVAAGLLGEPIGVLDAGCSAGLTLLLDRYRFEYGPALGLGPLDSPVTITCELRGPAPAPARLPRIAARLGLDRSPVDVARAEDARWLLACVWPDTGRLPRTAAAIELARRYPPPTVSGDMVDGLDAALDTFEPDLPIVVISTSAYGYLAPGQRRAFVDMLARRGRRRPLAWLSAEQPGVVEVVPRPPGLDPAATVLGLVTFETGTAVGRALASCQAHGAWLRWSDPPTANPPGPAPPT